MNEKLQRRALRRGIGAYGWALLIYYLFLNYAVGIALEIQLIYEGFCAVIVSDGWEMFANGVTDAFSSVNQNGWGYVIACCMAVCAIPIWKGSAFFKNLFQTKQTMTAKSFLDLLFIFFSGQLFFQVIAIVEEMLLNQFGISVLESMEMASASADSFSMFLYMGLAAPVVEEIVFRGVILRGLEPYGKRFAVVASAVLFGLFHGNLVQSPYAFAVGLVLGYTAMEYSIGWAMVLHMVNNLILGDSLLRLMSFLPVGMADMVYWGIYLLSGIASVVILVRNRHQIRAWFRDNPMVKGTVKAFFTAPANLILIVLMSLNAIMMLSM